LERKEYELTRGNVIEKWANYHPKVMTWLAKLQRKNINAWNLWIYCKLTNKTPNELLALKENPGSKDAEYLLDEFVANKNTGLPESVKIAVVISAKSFYKHNYTELARACGQVTFIKKFPYRKHTKEEVLKIYRATQNPRDRALITFTWSTGVAKESLSNIKWKHLEEKWELQEIPHIGIPDVLLKGHGIGKYKGVEQHTFLTPEAKRDLIDYKDWLERVKKVEITLEDFIFVETHPPYKQMSYKDSGTIAWRLNERSGIKFGWHDARRYVETALEETKINPNWARKIRGRKVRGEENPYSRPAIEQLRQAFREAVPLLEFTQPTTLMEMQKRQKVVEELTDKLMAGESLSEEDRQNISRYGIRLGMKADQLKKRLAKKKNSDCPDGVNCGEEFKQINESDLLQCLKDGWQIVHKLGNGDLVIRR
jgi:hypothetical protein